MINCYEINLVPITERERERVSVPMSGSVFVPLHSQFVPSATSEDVESDAESLASVPLQMQSDPDPLELALLSDDELRRRRLPSELSLYVHAVPPSDELDEGLYPEYELDAVSSASTMAISMPSISVPLPLG